MFSEEDTAYSLISLSVLNLRNTNHLRLGRRRVAAVGLGRKQTFSTASEAL